MEILRSLHYPSEVWALVRYNYGGGKNTVLRPTLKYDSLTTNMTRCYELLHQTSRSFAAVIQALDGDLRNAICIFYLVLRALDTVEDDMTIAHDRKVPLLREFYKHLYEPEWNFMDSKEKDRAVLVEFSKISAEFRELKQEFRDVISDITQKMGEGMCVFLSSPVETMEDWDEYCHYAAGLVGIGLSRLFVASRLEGGEVNEQLRLANNMGLFLQKTNIIRDYLEDSLDQREFWPKEAWSQFVSELKDFRDPTNIREAVHCLNLLITNALQQVPDVLDYMAHIHNQSVFNFCAIPQAMAIATLALCYNNRDVFSGVVKIRKGQAVQLIMGCTSLDSLKTIVANYSMEILHKLDPADPTADRTRAIINSILQRCMSSPQQGLSSTPPGSRSRYLTQYKAPLLSIAALIVLSYIYTAGYVSQ